MHASSDFFFIHSQHAGCGSEPGVVTHPFLPKVCAAAVAYETLPVDAPRPMDLMFPAAIDSGPVTMRGAPSVFFVVPAWPGAAKSQWFGSIVK